MVSVSNNSEIKVFLVLFRSGISGRESLPTVCMATQESSMHLVSPTKEITLPQEELMELSWSGKVHLPKKVANQSSRKGCVSQDTE